MRLQPTSTLLVIGLSLNSCGLSEEISVAQKSQSSPHIAQTLAHKNEATVVQSDESARAATAAATEDEPEAVEEDARDDGSEAFLSALTKAPNGELGENKILVEIQRCNVNYMLYEPRAGAEKVHKGTPAEVIELVPRNYALVQPAPGKRGRWVFTDPYLLGYLCRRIKESRYADRLPPSRIKEIIDKTKKFKTDVFGTDDKYMRRGWYPASCLKPVLSDEKIPTGSDLNPKDKTGRQLGVPCDHCSPKQQFTLKGCNYDTFPADLGDINDYTFVNSYLYLSYNTKEPQGFVSGFLKENANFHGVDCVRAARKVPSHTPPECGTDETDQPAKTQYRAWWYGYSPNRSRGNWGWVLADCLELPDGTKPALTTCPKAKTGSLYEADQ